MRSERFCRPVSRSFLILAAIAALASGTIIFGDDFEDPISPSGASGAADGVAFGDTEIEPEDVGGLAIDAKEALEPQVTVMLLMEDGGDAPGDTVAVEAWPTFFGWVKHPDSP